jgi:DNA repair protein RadC
MKFKIEVETECSPEELRRVMGLPDVQPMQQAVMAEVEKRMLAHMERFSPEGVLKTWLGAPEQMQKMLASFMGQKTTKQ